ncbi:hypothetical protein ETA_13800 [Erwinia tasmaniensis Et1/99]|uniref:Uncharacterized protein n=1 Tax=Erwinia tasmaniensis (strain DSM 17950 / CFBP 7177 / CIP 109463 / NCPPB 4357 / Et1/99) TaxID=465817 RepID=B2VFI7_ERWT9|nr:hypothetical protein ETA_13800 [Erwinia tasmaniensis Et1/99]
MAMTLAHLARQPARWDRMPAPAMSNVFNAVLPLSNGDNPQRIRFVYFSVC